MFGFKPKFPNTPPMSRDEAIYTPFRNGLSSSSVDHSPSRILSCAVICLLVVTNILTITHLVTTKSLLGRLTATEPEYIPKSAARVPTLPTQWKRFNWVTEYADVNSTEAQQLWDDINYSHGIIAVDHQVAEDQNWPDAMRSPSDPSKKVYLLEGYHLLHCIVVVRKAFWEAIHNVEEYTFEPPHTGHCLDQLRQYIICKADNTPLYSFGTADTGDQQYRKCHSWDALRDFATDHSACYRETPGADEDEAALAAHFGHCDGGYDGVKDGERRGPHPDGAVHRPE